MSELLTAFKKAVSSSDTRQQVGMIETDLGKEDASDKFIHLLLVCLDRIDELLPIQGSGSEKLFFLLLPGLDFNFVFV